MDLHGRLARVEDAIRVFHLPPTRHPVLDRSVSHDKVGGDPLPGLRYLRDEVKRDAEVLDKLLRENASLSAVSTNAPYLIAVWDELVHAHHPVAIYRTFSPANGQGDKGKRKAAPVKVDVVAENGARWVRVNTIKNTRLMMEFREIDSYLTSDDEDDPRPRLAPTKFDNSVLRMGRELLAAAQANPVAHCGTTIVPKVTLRLTRLDPLQDDLDPRIEETINSLRHMGIDVQLGERSRPPSPPVATTPRPLMPTANINLDLSALIALVSDISHSPLPHTEEKAHARFVPPQTYLDWERDRTKLLARLTDDGGDGGTWESSGQHSRALAAQAMQEINKGFLEEMHACVPATGVAFWTTSEARHRCLQIVSKIGGERERQRADALLDSTFLPVPAPAHTHAKDDADVKGNAAYWEHSRYPAEFLPLVPVCVYPSVPPAMADGEAQTPFFDALMRTCTRILSETAPQAADEERPAVQTCVPKLTAHTVGSMLAGACRGHTTLTTNRGSVRAVLKEMRREGVWGGHDAEQAGLWVLDPRSLSEGNRCLV